MRSAHPYLEGCAYPWGVSKGYLGANRTRQPDTAAARPARPFAVRSWRAARSSTATLRTSGPDCSHSSSPTTADFDSQTARPGASPGPISHHATE